MPLLRRLVTEQILLKHIGRYRFASERGLPILGTMAALRHLSVCLGRYRVFFMRYIILA